MVSPPARGRETRALGRDSDGVYESPVDGGFRVAPPHGDQLVGLVFPIHLVDPETLAADDVSPLGSPLVSVIGDDVVKVRVCVLVAVALDETLRVVAELFRIRLFLGSQGRPRKVFR